MNFNKKVFIEFGIEEKCNIYFYSESNIYQKPILGISFSTLNFTKYESDLILKTNFMVLSKFLARNSFEPVIEKCDLRKLYYMIIYFIKEYLIIL